MTEVKQEVNIDERITYERGHFDVYVQPDFERTISDQLSFLKKHIG